MEHDSDSPVTSESQTPTFPVGGGGNAGGTARMPGMMHGMASMMPQPQMAGMMPGYYNMYPWCAGMGEMVPQMPGVSATMTGMAPVPMMPQMPGMMMQGMPAAAAGSRVGVPQSPGDNVYRPYMDLLSGGSQSTPLETQFTGIETFSFEELGISPIRESPIEIPPAVGGRVASIGKSKKKGKGKGTSESWRNGDEGKRTVWGEAECVALAKAWVSIVEDPYIGANQTIDRIWWRISQNYVKFCPAGGKAHDGEQCRKQWERVRRAFTRFAGIYENNVRTATSGMSMKDVKNLSLQQYPEKKKFGPFKYWDAYVVLQDSAKFRAGIEAGWPKRTKLNDSGEYSSSAGSHDLPDGAEEIPILP